MFACLVISLLVTITSAGPTGREDVVYPSVETLRSGIKRIKFRAIDQDIDLRLIPAGDLISDDLAIYIGEHERTQPREDTKILKKKLYRDSEKGAALHIDEDGYFPVIHGIISHKLRIEPEETVREGRRAHRVFEVENKPKGRIRTNDAILIPEDIAYNETEDERQTDKCIVIEITFVSEKKFTHFFKTTEYHICYLTVTIGQVQNLIDTMNLTITFSLIGIIIYNNDYQAPFIGQSAIDICPEFLDCNALISNMATYFSKQNIPEITKADAVMLITGTEMAEVYYERCYTGTCGIAYVAGACDYKYKYSISEHDESDIYEYCHTVGHEMAHLMAAPHDEEKPVSYIPGSPGTLTCLWSHGHIMSYDTNPQNGTKFSPCSSACVKHFSSLRMARCIVVACTG